MAIERKTKGSRKVKPPRKSSTGTVTMRSSSMPREVPWMLASIFLAVLLVVMGSWAYTMHRQIQDYENREGIIDTTDLSMNMEATRTILAQQVTYEGTWVQEDAGLFEVYLPLDVFETQELNSIAATVNRDVDYDNALDEAYGVLINDTRFTQDISDVEDDLLNLVRDDLLSDMTKVTYGYNPSPVYELETITYNNSQAIKVSGSVSFDRLMIKDYATPEDDPDKIYVDNYTYDIMAFITLQRGYPVVLWCIWDPLDYFATENAGYYLNECLTTLWQTKYLEDRPVWTPVPTTVDENGYIVFLNDDGTIDNTRSPGYSGLDADGIAIADPDYIPEDTGVSDDYEETGEPEVLPEGSDYEGNVG